MKEEKTITSKSCCQDLEKPENRGNIGLIALALGIGAALLSSICCAGPLLAVVLGVSGAIALAGLGKYHAYFVIAAGLLMVGGVAYIRRRQKCCPSNGNMKSFLSPLLVTFGVFVLLMLGINQVLIPHLSAQSSKGTSVPTVSPTAADLRQARLAIEGMTCAGCAGTIQIALSKALGVTESSVSFEDKQARVVYDARRTSPEKLIAVVAEAHYTVRVVKDEAKR